MKQGQELAVSSWSNEHWLSSGTGSHAVGSDLADLSSPVGSRQIRSAEGSYQQLGIVRDDPMNSPFPETQHGVFLIYCPGEYGFVGAAQFLDQLLGNQGMMRHHIIHR